MTREEFQNKLNVAGSIALKLLDKLQEDIDLLSCETEAEIRKIEAYVEACHEQYVIDSIVNLCLTGK